MSPGSPESKHKTLSPQRKTDSKAGNRGACIHRNLELQSKYNGQHTVYPCQFKSVNSRTRLFCVFIIHWNNFASFSPSNGLFVTTKYRNVLMSLFLVQNTKTRIPVACWINQLPRPRQNVNFNVRNTLFVSIKNPREESQTSVSHFLIISVWMTFEPYLSKQNQIEI